MDATSCKLPFHGSIAFARAYDNPLNEDEVAALYGQITARQALTKIDDLNTALLTTIPGASYGQATKNALLKKGWAIMGDMTTTDAQIDAFIAELADPDEVDGTISAKWINVMFNAAGAVNVGEGASSFVPAAVGSPVTSYDPSIKFWTANFSNTESGVDGRSSDFFKVNFNSSLNTTEERFSMEVYCKSSDALDRTPFDYLPNRGYGFRQSGPGGAMQARIAAIQFSDSQMDTADFSDAPITGSYNHYVFTYESNNRIDGMTGPITVYLNGVYAGITNVVGNNGWRTLWLPYADQYFVIGGSTLAGSNATQCKLPFNGNVVFARMYTEVLTADDVTALHGQITKRQAVARFDDLNTALTVTIPAMADGAAKTALLAEGWGLMNNISTTEKQITKFLAKL